MRLRKFAAVGAALLFLASGLPLMAQTAPPSSAPPAVSMHAAQVRPLDLFLQQLERELSQRFREAGEKLGVQLPRGTPIPGMAIGIFPDGSLAATVPSIELFGLRSLPRRDLNLGLLYLSAPRGSSLPNGFYKLVLPAGERRVLLVWMTPNGRRMEGSFPARIEPSSIDSSHNPTIVPGWELSPAPGEAQRAKVKVTVHFDKITITIEVEW